MIKMYFVNNKDVIIKACVSRNNDQQMGICKGHLTDQATVVVLFKTASIHFLTSGSSFFLFYPVIGRSKMFKNYHSDLRDGNQPRYYKKEP